MTVAKIPCLHVCVTCRGGQPLVEGQPVMGQRLHDAIIDLHDPQALRVQAVSCMASCERGCTAAISASGKWSYLLAHLGPELAGDLIAYTEAYAASANGTVLPSRRAASLRHVILGRLPAAEIEA